MNHHRTSASIVLVLCAASFALMLGSSLRDSAVVDELAHIPAGYAYDRLLDYRLNPEHPPLVKALAAIPLVGMNLSFPTENTFWTTEVNGEWGVGGAFLYGLGNDAYAIIDWARVLPMLLTVALIIFTFLWARRLYGPWWALLPAFLTGLSPIILAHGHYVTTDVAAALGAMLGLYTFVKFMEEPSKKTLAIAAVGFGVAEMMKFSAVVLIPVYLLLIIFYFFATAARDRYEGHVRWSALGRRSLKDLGSFFLIIVIGYLAIVYPLYAVFTVNYPTARQASDTQAILHDLASAPCSFTKPIPCFASLDISMAGHALTRPIAHYLLGVIMVTQRLSGTNVSYFLGHVYANGTQYYFPVVYGLKEPLPILALIAGALILAILRILRALRRPRHTLQRYILEHFPQFAMLAFVTIYWAWSVMSPLNIGVRHLIPTLPFIYLLTTSALRRLPPAGIWVIGVMLIWLAGETIVAYPRYLSYYNEVAGGTSQGYRFADDSNYDWGQDIYELKDFMNAHPEIDRLALDFFGASNPSYYLGDKYVAWKSSMGNPADQGIHWFAISITNLENAIQPPADGYSRAPNDSYEWLTAMRAKPDDMGGVPAPDYRIGTTIFVYKL